MRRCGYLFAAAVVLFGIFSAHAENLAISPAASGGGGGAPTGPAGGSLGGTYPNPTVVTNANLTGPITSVGNATSIASQTGSGTKFVVDTSPTLITPALGVATGTSVAVGGCTIGSDVFCTTGTATFGGATVVSGASFGLSGNISAPAWTTAGIRYKNVAATLTDTTSSGTVAAARTDNFGGNTIAASSATTYTSYYSAYFSNPTSGTNVTFTNKSAVGADSISINAQAQSTFALAVNGTSNLNGGVSIGAGSAITSSGAGGSLGSNAFTSTAFLPLTGGTLTGNLTISGAGFLTSGNLSTAAWTTNGVRAQMAAASYTDSSSSGTVANAYTDLFGASTILASSATTYTSYYGAYFKTPVASTNVTFTNKSALGADSISVNGQAQSTFALAVNGTSNLNGAGTFSNNNIGVVSTDSIIISNTTAAALGAQQFSPRLHFIGAGWGTTGSASQTVDWVMEVQPLQGAAGPGGGLVISAQTNGGGYVKFADYGVTSAGAWNFANVLQGGSLSSSGAIVIGASSAYNWNGRGALTSPGSNQVQFGNASAASPAAQTVSFQSVVAGTTNTSGVNATFTGSTSTGSGTAGDLIFQTGGTGAGATAQNAQVTVLTMKGATQNLVGGATTDASASSGSGALQIAGGASVAKRFWLPAITTSAGLQTAVLCQSSGGEVIADSVACLASSERFKQDITASDLGLAAVLAMQPITYRYAPTGNARFDDAPNQRDIHAGLRAEDVARIDRRLVAYDADGEVRTIRQDSVISVLVKAVQEQQHEIDAIKRKVR